jgi:FkbM family methyltransferase
LLSRRWLGSTYFAVSHNRALRFLRKMPLLGLAMQGVSHLLLPSSRIWMEVQSGLGRGLRLHLNPRYDERFWVGDYEERVQEVLATRLKPGFVVYDVGAHIGFLSLIAARLVGSKGKVFAFEADPENASKIQEHIEANSFRTISVVASPVWSSNKRVSFTRASENSGRFVGKVSDEAEGMDGFSELAITLDGFGRENAWPDFIKMDIEGGEVESLRGASHIFESVKPFLVLEVHNGKAEEHVRHWFRNWEYDYNWLGPGPTSLPCQLIAWPRRK